MIKVVGHRVLVKPFSVKDIKNQDVPEDLRAVGFEISLTPEEEKREKTGIDRGTVVGIGDTCWKSPDLGYGSPEWHPWCKLGDEVGFARYAGKLVVDPHTKEEFYLMNDVDVQVIFSEGQNA